MLRREKNYAFIDTQNLYLSLKNGFDWKLDFNRFRVFLRERFSVDKAYLFIGFIESNKGLYKSLASQGYELVFKPTITHKDGLLKGNCDAELVLWAMAEFPNYDKAVLVSGDGDFYCLAEYLKNRSKLACVLIPNEHRYSKLLNRINDDSAKFIQFVNRARKSLNPK